MINPNEVYKSAQIALITQIEDCKYLAQFTVTFGNGRTYKGFIKDIPNFKRFRVGDYVKVGAQFSIMSDTFLIKTLRKINKVKE